MGGTAFVGRVVSNRMQKTVVVAVDYVVWRPKLKMYEKRTSKHFAHDERQACDIGDTVRIRWTPRRSKHKSYEVTEILRKVSVYDPKMGELAASEAAAAAQAPVSRVELAEGQYQQAQQRLEQLRSLRRQYEQDHAAEELAGGSGKPAAAAAASSGTGGTGSGGGSGGSSGSASASGS